MYKHKGTRCEVSGVSDIGTCRHFLYDVTIKGALCWYVSIEALLRNKPCSCGNVLDSI